MKRTLALSLILAALLSPLHAAEWNSSTSGDQTVAENVTVTDTANVGNITFNGDSVVSGSGSIGGSGNITVNSGTVVFDGVSRPNSTGNITIASGATLEVKNGAQILTTGGHNASSVVTVNGTLKVEALNYGGSLGVLHDNIGVQGYTESLVLNSPNYASSAAVCSRVEITESGSATIGARLNGWGTYFTFAVADGKEFSWNYSTNGNVIAFEGAGSVLVLEAGEGATFTLGKNIGTGLSINKNGAGTLVLNSTLNLDSGRRININSGTVKFGDSARITSAGDGFFVGTDATMDLEGKGGISGQAVTVNGAVLNGQNNEMNITLGSTGSFSLSDDATSGYHGTIVLAEGAEVDLGDYVFYNTIDISAGGSLLNATNHRGTIMLGADEDGVTALDSETLAQYSSSIASTGSIEVSISEDIECTAPDFTLLKGRFYAEDSVSVTGTGAEDLTIDGYTTAYGAVSAQNGDISISEVNNVTLSNNGASDGMTEDYHRAGALSAAGSVSIEAAGEVSISGNSVAVQSTAAGAIWAGSGDVTITAASISITDNTATDGACSGGAIRSDWGSIYLTSEEGKVEICGNTAEESGGALYGASSVDVVSAADIVIADNTATMSDGGAIYSDGDVSLTAGESGSVRVTGNQAGGYGGAIYSYGTVYLGGSAIEMSNNHADGGGGAIFADSVVISADAGDIVFSGNTQGDGEANDIELYYGTADLSASNGYNLELQGGITNAAGINITTDADSAVKLGGTSSTDSFSVSEGRVVGISNEDGTPATINVSTAVTLDSACLQDVFLVAEGATLESFESLYIFNEISAMEVGTLESDAVCITSSAPLLDGFVSINGDLSISLSAGFLTDALAAADGAAVDIVLTLCLEGSEIAEDGSFTFTLDDATIALLADYKLQEYGFYDAEGNLQDPNSITLTEAGNVVFAVKQMTLIPEPTTTALSLLALSALCLRRRRQK